MDIFIVLVLVVVVMVLALWAIDYLPVPEPQHKGLLKFLVVALAIVYIVVRLLPK